jgi:lipoyl(octanoyl) transferase
LERKIANWIELGIMPYSETMTLQDKLVNMRKKDLIPDTILSVQHPLTVSFGADKKNNKFSQMLLFAVNEQYGNIEEANIRDYLIRQRATFVESSRGGGATVFAPGQFVFYPIVDHTLLTNSHQLDLAAYKNLIYKTLFDSLTGLGINGLNVGSQESFKTRAERRDAWIVREGVTYKMGSKGLGMNGKVAYNGFAINATKEGTSRNWMVDQCGYQPHEVKVWSVEEELRRPVKPEEVYSAAQKAILRNFGYAGLQTIKLHEVEGVVA